MKVALVYPIAFGTGGVFGGGERYALSLARAMASMEETVLVTTGMARTSDRDGDLRIETYPWITLVRGLRQNPLTFRFLRSLVDADVIHCLTYSTLITDLSVLFGRAFHKRVFITDVGGGGDVTLVRVMNVARLAHGLLLLSQFADACFPPGGPARSVIYGGVDVERFTPSTEPRGRSVLYVGRLLAHKGVNYLIESVDRETELVIAGRPYDPGYYAELRRMAVGRNIRFLEDATDDELLHEYQSAAVAVLPSVYRDIYGNWSQAPELLGLSLLEAMACATPVICTQVGAMPEIVDAGMTGFVVPPNDGAALGDRIRQILGDPELGIALGQRARAHILERFTWHAVAERCLRAYQGLPAAVEPPAQRAAPAVGAAVPGEGQGVW